MAQVLNLDFVQNIAVVSLNDGTQVMTEINAFPFQVSQGMMLDLQFDGMKLVGVLNNQQYTITNFQVMQQTQTVNQQVGQVMDKIANNQQVQEATKMLATSLDDKNFWKTVTMIFASNVSLLFFVNIFAALAGKIKGEYKGNGYYISVDNEFALHMTNFFNIILIVSIFLLFGILVFKAITNLNAIKKNIILCGSMAIVGMVNLIVAFNAQGLYWAIESFIGKITEERAMLLEQNGTAKTISAFAKGEYGWISVMQVIFLLVTIVVAVLAYLQFFKWPNEDVFVKIKNMISQPKSQQQFGQQPQQFGQQPQQFGQQPRPQFGEPKPQPQPRPRFGEPKPQPQSRPQFGQQPQERQK